MNMIWRPACPRRLMWSAEPNTEPMKTVKSSALPTMPTGQAQILRRMPPRALASPKRLPMTSRQRRNPPPANSSLASKSHRRKSIVTFPFETAMAPGGNVRPRHAGCKGARRLVHHALDLTAKAVRASPIQTLTVGSGISPDQPCAPCCFQWAARGSRTITAGSELHRPRST